MSDRLSRRTKLLYGVGDTGFSLTTTIIGAYFAIFLTDVEGQLNIVPRYRVNFGRRPDDKQGKL
jgi:Na+/melibiose symporter-like transporter